MKTTVPADALESRVTQMERVTACLSTPDLYDLVAAALNSLDQRGEEIGPDSIPGDAASVVYDRDTDRYAVEVNEEVVRDADYYQGTVSASLELIQGAFSTAAVPVNVLGVRVVGR